MKNVSGDYFSKNACKKPFLGTGLIIILNIVWKLIWITGSGTVIIVLFRK